MAAKTTTMSTEAQESVTLVQTVDEAIKACEEIRNCQWISFDMEGKNLGKSGEISTLQIAIDQHAKKNFVFDYIAMGNTVPNELKSILQDGNVKKLMFDCRQDAHVLATKVGIQLEGVVDLQLGEILQRKDSPAEALERLCGALHGGNVRGSPDLYKDVVRLSSLSFCMEKLGIGDEKDRQMKDKVAKMFRYDQNYWMKRPLDSEAISYASQDVSVLFDLARKLYGDHYQQAIVNQYQLIAASRRYAKLLQQFATNSNQEYFNHPLLPLGVMEDVDYPTLDCIRCNRLLDERFFSKSSRRDDTKRKCAVCRAIDIQTATQAQWNRNDDYNDCGGYDSGDDF